VLEFENSRPMSFGPPEELTDGLTACFTMKKGYRNYFAMKVPAPICG
jgi:hypothetical protein